MRKTESRRYSGVERALSWRSEGWSRLVIEGRARAKADGIGDGMTAATSPLRVRACVRPSPSLQQSSAFAELPAPSDFAQHASRICADASQPMHTVANVGMNPIRSASAVTTAIRRERMRSIVDIPRRPVKSEISPLNLLEGFLGLRAKQSRRRRIPANHRRGEVATS
jgi:hypothetical protein